MEVSGVFGIIATALEAQRERMNIIVSNMVNVHTTRTEEGGPYRRRDVIFMPVEIEDGSEIMKGVKVEEIIEDPTPFKVIYDPGHPDADEKGYVRFPNVDILEEMVNMMMTFRAYEASLSAFNTFKSMLTKTLELGRS